HASIGRYCTARRTRGRPVAGARVLWRKGRFGLDSGVRSDFAERMPTVIASGHQQAQRLPAYLLAASGAAPGAARLVAAHGTGRDLSGYQGQGGAISNGAQTVASATRLPVVDFAGFSSSDAAERATTTAALRPAFEGIGCLYLRNHGVPESVLDAVFAQ